jgi:hypothetical protein
VVSAIEEAKRLLIESADEETRRVISGLLDTITQRRLNEELPPLGLDGPPTIEEIKERRQELGRRRKLLDAKSSALRAQFEALWAACDHKEGRYSQNTWGRDPGGGGCRTCGAVW